jgi:TIR domain/LGFP repeat
MSGAARREPPVTDPTEPRSFDVFISYSHQDLKFTEALAERLEAAGGQVFLDKWEIVPGDVLTHRLDDGIRRSRAGILVFSPAATASRWVMEEYAALINSGRRFIPVLYRDTELPPIAAARVHVDFRDATDSQFELKVTELVRALQDKPPADRPGRAGPVSFSDPGFWRLHPESIAEELAGLDPRTVAMTMSAVEPKAAAPVLAVLDAADAVATVAHMRTESAGPLVSAIGAGERAALLRDTITARDRIAELGRRHQAILGRPTSPLQGHEPGFFREFDNGMVLWSAKSGAHPVWHGVYHRFRQLGGVASLGYPAGNEEVIGGGPAVRQRFDDSTIYWKNPQIGAYSTSGRVAQFYKKLGGPERSGLGFPVAEAERLQPNIGFGRRQRFEHGFIFLRGLMMTVSVIGAFATYYEQHEEELGRPTDEARMAAVSSSGTEGRVQYFDGRWRYPNDIVMAEKGSAGAAIYTSRHGTHLVSAGIGVLHERAGGTGGWLGFPVADSTTAPGGSFQCFEGGVVFYSPTYDCVAVPNPPGRALPDPAQLIDRLGYPTADASIAGDRVQFFERGLMSVQDGQTRFWTPAGL